jgi:O-antigen ligase/polysaccharide polymerase Wzy-like membrane protein
MGVTGTDSSTAAPLEPLPEHQASATPLPPGRGGLGRRVRLEPAAIVLLVFLSAVWTWWALRQGAYFGVVQLPGIMVLCIGAILLALWAPLRVRLSLSPRAKIAGLALAGLGLWTLLSATWSPAPDVAVRDAQRVLAYALSFGLGIWLCNLVGHRMHLAWAPIAVASGLVALVTALVVLFGSDLATYLDVDGTLQYPLGYRNANAAFFAIGMWPLLATARAKAISWLLRGAAAGGGSLCFSLALLSQSRGFQLAAVVAAVILILSSQERLPAVGWLGVIVAPSLLVAPYLSDLYATTGGQHQFLAPLHHAAGAALAAAALAATIGAAAARVTWFAPSPGRVRRQNRMVACSVAGLAVAGVLGFLVVAGNPVSWFDQKINEFQHDKSSESSTRFGFNVASPRGDLWRVAAGDGFRDPVFGDGAGGFHYSYLQRRDNPDETVRDAHSIELETFSELGLPGLALLAIALFAAAAAIVRAGALGPGSASLATVALTAGSYWLLHSSIDWFWPYPAVSAPVMCLLGAACAPGMRTATRVPRGHGRRWLAGAAAVLAVSVIPPYLSDRYVNNAISGWRSNTAQALSDLDRAHALFPLSIESLMTRGAIARASGRRALAIEAFSDAADQRPEEWAAHYYLARLYAKRNPALARRELDTALQLDPREPLLRDYERRLASGQG